MDSFSTPRCPGLPSERCKGVTFADAQLHADRAVASHSPVAQQVPHVLPFRPFYLYKSL